MVEATQSRGGLFLEQTASLEPQASPPDHDQGGQYDVTPSIALTFYR